MTETVPGDAQPVEDPWRGWWLNYSDFWRDSVLKDLVKNAVQVAVGTSVAVACGVIEPSDKQAQALVRVVATLYLPTMVGLAFATFLANLRVLWPPLLVVAVCSLVAMFSIGLRADPGYPSVVALLGVVPFVTVGAGYLTLKLVRALRRGRVREGAGLIANAVGVLLLMLIAFFVMRWVTG